LVTQSAHFGPLIILSRLLRPPQMVGILIESLELPLIDYSGTPNVPPEVSANSDPCSLSLHAFIGLICATWPISSPLIYQILTYQELFLFFIPKAVYNHSSQLTGAIFD